MTHRCLHALKQLLWRECVVCLCAACPSDDAVQLMLDIITHPKELIAAQHLHCKVLRRQHPVCTPRYSRQVRVAESRVGRQLVLRLLELLDSLILPRDRFLQHKLRQFSGSGHKMRAKSTCSTCSISCARYPPRSSILEEPYVWRTMCSIADSSTDLGCCSTSAPPSSAATA